MRGTDKQIDYAKTLTDKLIYSINMALENRKAHAADSKSRNKVTILADVMTMIAPILIDKINSYNYAGDLINDIKLDNIVTKDKIISIIKANDDIRTILANAQKDGIIDNEFNDYLVKKSFRSFI